MATVTGLTAERMLEIEAESVIDGDVVGDNLILRRHDGTTIDAGSVRGPKGNTGNAGISVAQNNLPILDVGQLGQIRAGRQLTATDFTRMGLQQPIGLFNLSDLNNLGSVGPLTNKGAVPFGIGINGLASTAAVFAGSGGQALYIADAAGGPFNPKTFTLGAWFRTAKRGTTLQTIAGKNGPGASSVTGCYLLYVNSNNNLQAWVTDGATDGNAIGFTDVCDDRWHFAVMSWDGSMLRLYLDGVLEAETNSWVAASGAYGFIGAPAQINEPFSIGASDADAATVANMFWGRIDEVFFTPEVVSDDQQRVLYCTKIAHGAASQPINVMTNVHRRRRGPLYVVGDFSSQPRRLYNLGSVADLGVDNAALTPNAAPLLGAGPDGAKDGAYIFNGSSQFFSAAAAGLPSGTAARTIGCWFKTHSANGTLIDMGQSGVGQTILYIDSTGALRISDLSVGVSAPGSVTDDQWHFAVAVIDPTAIDGNKQKLYLDGRLVGVSTTYGGSGNNVGGLTIGRQALTAATYLKGMVSRAFITDYAMMPEQLRDLYAKGTQDVGASPKAAAAHIEAIDSTYLYANFDSLDSQHLVDLAVAA